MEITISKTTLTGGAAALLLEGLAPGSVAALAGSPPAPLAPGATAPTSETAHALVSVVSQQAVDTGNHTGEFG